MYVERIIDECKSICAERTNSFLTKQIRNKQFKETPETYNNIWIRNYCTQFIVDLLEHIDEYERIFCALGDTSSQNTFREICIKRFLYTISLENQFCFTQYPQETFYDKLLSDIECNNLIHKGSEGKKDSQYSWKGFHIISETKNIAALEIGQYSYKDKVRIRDNYTVLDCGASQGEEVLYFLSLAKGLVFHSFALDDKEIEIYIKNMSNNGVKNYTVNRNALWSKSHVEVTYEEDGSRSNVSDYGETFISTITLNDYIIDKNCQAPFFIKMDIEGSEFEALSSSSNILKLPSTQAAISVYHHPNDIRRIGMLLLNYRKRLFIKQCKSNLSETIMYLGTEE